MLKNVICLNQNAYYELDHEDELKSNQIFYHKYRSSVLLSINQKILGVYYGSQGPLMSLSDFPNIEE